MLLTDEESEDDRRALPAFWYSPLPANAPKASGFGGLQGQILPPKMPLPALGRDSSASLFSAMPSAPPVQHMESTDYWSAAPNAAGASLPNPYLSPLPPTESRADAAYRTSLDRWRAIGNIARKFATGDLNWEAAGEYIADRFNNPPHEPSLIGMAGETYRGFTGPLPQYGDREAMIAKASPLAGLAMTGPMPLVFGAAAPRSTLGVFVGPTGAARLTGGGPHPAVDPARAISDLEAQAILQARKQAGDLRDADIWQRSAWSWGREGKLKKELPDTGARLEATGNRTALGDEYLLRHPAGDVHGVYDIKPMVIGPRVGARYRRGTAFFDEETGRIYIDGDMRTAQGVALARSKALEELQHAIQAREGFARGADPIEEVYFPEYWRTLGREMPSVRENPEVFRQHQEVIARGVSNRAERDTPEFRAAFAAYERAAGEAEAANVLRRLEQPFLYRMHPRRTARKDQIVRDPDAKREAINEAYRWGAFRSPRDD